MKVSEHIKKAVTIKRKKKYNSYYFSIGFLDLKREEMKLAFDYAFSSLKRRKTIKYLPVICFDKIYLDMVYFQVGIDVHNVFLYWKEDSFYLEIEVYYTRNIEMYIECNKAVVDFRKFLEFAVRTFYLLKPDNKLYFSLSKDYKNGEIGIYGEQDIKNELLKRKNIRNFIVRHCLLARLKKLKENKLQNTK